MYIKNIFLYIVYITFHKVSFAHTVAYANSIRVIQRKTRDDKKGW